MAQRRKVADSDVNPFDEMVERIYRVEHEWHAYDSCCLDDTFAHSCVATGDKCKGERIAIQLKQVRGYSKKPIKPVFVLTRYRRVDKKGNESWDYRGRFRGLSDMPQRKLIRVLEKCNMMVNEIAIHLPASARNTDEWMMTMRNGLHNEFELPRNYAILWDILMNSYVRKIAKPRMIPKGWKAEKTSGGGHLLRKIYYAVDSIDFSTKILSADDHADFRLTFRFDDDTNSLGISVQDKMTNGITIKVTEWAKQMNQKAAEARRFYIQKIEKTIEANDRKSPENGKTK